MANQHKEKLRGIRGVDEALWTDLDHAAKQAGSDRSKVTKDLWEWYVGRPGANLPKRPVERAAAETYKPIPPGARWPSPWDYDPRGIDGGDPDTACGEGLRTEHQGVARCRRGLGHPGAHNGPADDGTAFQWDERPASSEEKTA